MLTRDRIVIGASAGGVSALRELVAGFTADLPAAVFITLHMFGREEVIIQDLLNAAGPLRASVAQEGEEIENGRLYIAPPDFHLSFSSQKMHITHGPKEGLQRPSINVMFRSAAAVFGDRTAGVVLTGMLDDGAAGLWEILQHGGVTIVQDPEEAAYRSMPETAIHGLNVQYILRLREVAPLLTRLSMGERREIDWRPEVPQMENPSSDAVLTRQACPECGGVMRLEHRGGTREYVCHVGHRLGLQSMIADKTDVVERSMWTALSQSEELVELLQQSLQNADSDSRATLRNEIERRKEDSEKIRAVIARSRLSLGD